MVHIKRLNEMAEEVSSIPDNERMRKMDNITYRQWKENVRQDLLDNNYPEMANDKGFVDHIASFIWDEVKHNEADSLGSALDGFYYDGFIEEEYKIYIEHCEESNGYRGRGGRRISEGFHTSVAGCDYMVMVSDTRGRSRLDNMMKRTVKDTAKKYGGAVKYDAGKPYAIGAYFYTQLMAKRFYDEIKSSLSGNLAVDAYNVSTDENLTAIWG